MRTPHIRMRVNYAYHINCMDAVNSLVPFGPIFKKKHTEQIMFFSCSTQREYIIPAQNFIHITFYFTAQTSSQEVSQRSLCTEDPPDCLTTESSCIQNLQQVDLLEPTISPSLASQFFEPSAPPANHGLSSHESCNQWGPQAEQRIISQAFANTLGPPASQGLIPSTYGDPSVAFQVSEPSESHANPGLSSHELSDPRGPQVEERIISQAFANTLGPPASQGLISNTYVDPSGPPSDQCLISEAYGETPQPTADQTLSSQAFFDTPGLIYQHYILPAGAPDQFAFQGSVDQPGLLTDYRFNSSGANEPQLSTHMSFNTSTLFVHGISDWLNLADSDMSYDSSVFDMSSVVESRKENVSVLSNSYTQNQSQFNMFSNGNILNTYSSSTPIRPEHHNYTRDVSATLNENMDCNLDSPSTDTLDKKEKLPPLSAPEKVVLYDLFNREIHNSSDPTLFVSKFGKRSARWQRIPECYKSSSEASGRTLRRRAQFSEKVRDKTQSKLSKELVRLPNSEKSEVCKEAGIVSIHVSKEEGLALKTYAELPWFKLQKVMRFLSNKGATYEGESAQRKYKKELLGDLLQTSSVEFKFKDETNPFAVNGFILKKAPCCALSSLRIAVMQRCNELKENNLLTWHGEGIPLNQIWIKFNGDKGGGSTKNGFQVVNVEQANSPNNNVLVSVFEAPDNQYNMNLALERYSQEIKEIRQTKWEGKEFVIFGSGDCDYIYKMLGLGGASGTYPCYMCVIPAKQMQKKPGDRDKASYPKRTLAGIQNQYEKFKAGGSNLKKQSEYENVIHAPILPIEPTDYCPPYLHIDLGGADRLQDLLVIDVHGLDLDVGDSLAKFDWPVSNAKFDQYISVKKFVLMTEERIMEINEELEDWFEDNCDGSVTPAEIKDYKAKLVTEKSALETRKSELEAKLNLPSKEAGPLVDSLDKGLLRHGIRRQKYHSRTFVGNDVHKYLKKEVYTDVLDGMVKCCESLTGEPDIIERAEEVATKFKGAFARYSDIHTLLSHSKCIPTEDHPKIQKAIDNFMEYYRTNFPESSIPFKFHLLEDHAVEWLSKYPFGFGLLGEQGAESVHAVMNRLKRNYTAMASDDKRLQTVVEDQRLKCTPELNAYLPEKRKYVTKKSKLNNTC